MINQLQVDGLTDLQTLQGVAKGESGLGTFSGSTISDNTNIKTALQELETEVETTPSLSIGDLTDVTIGTPSNGDFLIWDTDHWEEKTPIGSDIGLVTTNFDNNLSAADDTVQKAMETIDELAIGSTASSISTVTTNFDGILSAADTNVQLALETIDDLDYIDSSTFSGHTSDGTIHYAQSAINIPASQISDFDTEVSNNTDVAANTTHRSSDGKDHSDVVLNNTHRSSDGKNHSDVVLNNTHRGSTGEDHTYINQDLRTTASPSFVNATLSGNANTTIPYFGTGGVIQSSTDLIFDSSVFYANSQIRIGNNKNFQSIDSGLSVRNIIKINTGDDFVSGAVDTGWGRDYLANSGRDFIVNVNRAISSATAMTVKASGNVGIGTSSPSVNLSVYHATTPKIHVQNSASGITSTDGFQFALASTNGYVWNFESGDLILGTNAQEKARIKSGGNFLIGTTTDSGYKLDVNGTFRAVGASQFDSTLVVGDHGTASTDQVVNVCYGTSATPPTASTTTEGALYIQYTA